MKVAGDQVQTFQPQHPEKSVREVAIKRRSEWLYVIKTSLLCLHELGRSVQRQARAGVGSGQAEARTPGPLFSSQEQEGSGGRGETTSIPTGRIQWSELTQGNFYNLCPQPLGNLAFS